MLRISGHKKNDYDYLTRYVRNLIKNLFGTESKISKRKGNDLSIIVHSRKLIEFFVRFNLKAGNKIKNQITIPKWIFENESYLRSCVRGLIDTDGSIFRMSKKDPNLLRINFKNFNQKLLRDTRAAFIKLSFHPSKIIGNNVFYISRKKGIVRYINEIGFSNMKHLKRFKEFNSSVV